MIPEAGEVLAAADFLAHGFVAVALRICVLFQRLLCIFPFFFQNNPSRDQIEFGFGTGEVQEFTTIQKRRACRTDMDFFGTALIQELSRLAELGTAHDGIVDQKQLLLINQRLHRNQLHAGDQISLLLIRRHKGTRPGRGIFDEWSCKRNLGLICIADCMGNSGIRHACNEIRVDIASRIALRQHRSAVVTHLLDVDALIRRRRVSIVNPEERTDLHFFLRRHKHLDALRRNKVDLSWSQFVVIGVAQVQIRKVFKRCTVGSLFFTDHERGAPLFITRGVDAVFCQKQQRHGAVHDILQMTDALWNRLLTADQGCGKLSRVDLAGAHLLEMGAAVAVNLF